MATTYTPGAGDIIVQGSVAVTEDLSRIGGVVAGCGWAALDVILHIAKGTATSPAEVTAIIQQAIAEGYSGQYGVATPAQIMHMASQYGVPLASMPYMAALAQYSGKRPIEIGISNARAFGGSDSNVAGHYITVVGKTQNGNYIVSDPNTPQSQRGQFVVYSLAQIAAARPFWAGVPTADSFQSSGSGSTSLIDTSGITNALKSTLAPLTGLSDTLGAFWNAVSGWITKPWRIVKLAAGAFMLIGVGIALVTGSDAGQATIRTVKSAAEVAALG